MINGASSLNGASSFNGYLVRLLLEPVHGMLRLNLTDEDKLRDDGSAVETMAVSGTTYLTDDWWTRLRDVAVHKDEGLVTTE